MSWVHIPYDNIIDLISSFQKMNFNNQVISKSCNFVLINEDSYWGSYGGIFSAMLIKDFENKKLSFIYDMITAKLCLIWWNCASDIKGDMSLTKDGFILITKQMYSKIQLKTFTKRFKSSYASLL